ncbi:phage head completion protein [Sphingomonas koreensis]|uniref:phage head completion protein n=1 Tax=Sphingomonas koreensis TaxID=93064 RepID=UPI000F7E5863|nr:head-tail adaptor protein [Sphingomonas koreensis]RSU21205.1 head-tail adaptor protein [Sphingomonas koreensis]RSU32230.1 head-tail adaptor protein [Sphingomonas koreensis]RSU35724.1 head-tail adaptor protein [Sphingomonas koreensis]RSU49895.1 head-tail adaptor protein [Sphingomonas koreensis]RSU83492.1 head-tail adaptor protein [Sphingomonas koreensis]
MRLAAGELDRRVQIWRAVPVDNGTATVPGEPAKIATRWARKLDVSDSERVRAAEQGQELGTRFLMRSDPVTREITGKDQLWHRGRFYEVTGVKESAEREDAVEIATVARPDETVEP